MVCGEVRSRRRWWACGGVDGGAGRGRRGAGRRGRPLEVDPREAAPVTAGRAGQAVGAAQTLQAALTSMVPAASVLLAKLGKVKPSQICAAGGLKLAAGRGGDHHHRRGARLRRQGALAAGLG